MLGVDQGHANVRDNQFDKALEDNYTLPGVLKEAGYATACIGKWGLQGVASTDAPNGWPAHPQNRGFDYFFGYISHMAGHAHYPKEDGSALYDGSQDVAANYDCCYTTDLFTARAKKWIVDQHATHPQQPFFVYLAFDTPHAKLEYPAAPYPAGGGLHGGMQWLGQPGDMISTANGKPDSYCYPEFANATYDDDHNPATPEVPWPDVYRRYASDTRRIDDCVGDVEQLLKDMKIDNDTLVIFTSDNGPSQESYLKQNNEANFFSSFGRWDQTRYVGRRNSGGRHRLVARPHPARRRLRIAFGLLGLDAHFHQPRGFARAGPDGWGFFVANAIGANRTGAFEPLFRVRLQRQNPELSAIRRRASRTHTPPNAGDPSRGLRGCPV